MNPIASFYLGAKHWQLVLLSIALTLLQVFALLSDATLVGNPTITKTVCSALNMLFLLGWMWSVGTFLNSLLEGTPLERVRFHHFPAYEPWCRDHGPIFLVRDEQGQRQRAVVDWNYNAWGGKYPPFDLDDAVPQHVARLRQLPLFSPGIILEGGSIEVNGNGVVLTTTSCLLNPNRNPQLGQGQVEKYLCDYLGVGRVLWLTEGIVGDDTDGHIDDLARFLNPTTIAAVVEHDTSDPNYPILRENLQRLRLMRDTAGRSFRIVELPMPAPVEYEGQRLPASYANFYIANGMVLVPTFRDKRDHVALETLQREFPDRQVIGIDSTELIWGLGSFHCITQQEPAG